ncbi:Serine/threonine-protein kinase Sgk3, partial [Coemansia erecta]
MGGLRMGRKRFLVYRILVTGQTSQWWVARRYSEFHELYQTLRRMFPQAANKWGEFPSKRLLPGLGSSNDSVMQRRERLNAFLRALMQTPQISQCSAMQQFLRDDPLDNDSVPLADREVAVREAMRQDNSNGNSKYGEFELVIHPPQNNDKQKPSLRQQTTRSVSSGSALPGADHSSLFAPWGTSGADTMPGEQQRNQKLQKSEKPSLAQLPPPVNVASPRTRESIERMKSMPSLKSAGAAPGVPNFDFSIPLPQNPAKFGGFSSLSASSGREARGMTQQSNSSQNNSSLFSPTMTGPLPMPRKISDPQEYTSAEKRPNSVNPSSMRKKYGLRRNMQYRNDGGTAKKSGSVGNGSHSQIPLPPQALHPDTAATLLEESQQWLRSSGQTQPIGNDAMNCDNDYIMVDDSDEKMNLGVNGSSMDIDHTLRGGSVDSEMSSEVSSPSSKRGRNVVVLRRAPFGGVEKQRRVLAENDPALVAAKKQLRNAKRFLASQFKETESADEDDDGKRRNNKAAGAPQKVSLADFHLLSLIGKGSY